MISIIPAIDIIEGRCVRLSQGDYASKKVYDGDPADLARAFADAGVRRVHLVDLEGAKAGEPVNLRALEKIASAVDVELEWGGGITSDSALSSVFSAGAGCGIVGSIAALKPELFQQWLLAFGPERMVLGADVREGRVSVKGWLEDTQLGISELVERFLPGGLSQCVVTDISRDGMLQGPSDQMYCELQQAYPGVDFTVSGGISSMADIERLNELGLRRVIVGKAFYEKRISLKDIEKWSLNV